MPDELLEAHAPADFLGKVQGLHQGEVARLAGGVAVKRMSTEDGRDGFRVAKPSSYRSDSLDFGYGDHHRTAEDAVRHAFRHSAESTDPESLGGSTRLSRWGPHEVGGAEVRIEDWTTDGKAVVRGPTGPSRTVDPTAVARRVPQLLASEETDGMLAETYSDAARKAALEARKAKHPDWNWGSHENAIRRLRPLEVHRIEPPGSGAAVTVRRDSTGYLVSTSEGHQHHRLGLQHAINQAKGHAERLHAATVPEKPKRTERDTSGREIPRGGIRALDSELLALRALGTGGDYPDPEVMKTHLRSLSADSLERLNKRVDKIIAGHQRHDHRMHQQNRRYQPSLGFVAPDGYMTKKMKGVQAAISRVLIEKYHGRVQEAESLDRSPKKNWVEKRGGLPQPIVHMAKDIHEERGIPLDQAIPIAISQAKKLAPKDAKYARAVAEWEKMKMREAEAAEPFWLPPIGG